MRKEDQSRMLKVATEVAKYFDCDIQQLTDKNKNTQSDRHKRKVLFLLYYKLLKISYKGINEYHYGLEDKKAERSVKYHLSNAKDDIVINREFKSDFTRIVGKIKSSDCQVTMEFGWDNEAKELIKKLQLSYHKMDKKAFINTMLEGIMII